jgi:hypothetical protein
MIVERWTFQIKPGGVDEAVALLLDAREQSPDKESIHILQSRFGATNRVLWARTYDNLAQHEQAWTEWAKQDNQAFLEKWSALRDGESQREIWELK